MLHEVTDEIGNRRLVYVPVNDNTVGALELNGDPSLDEGTAS